MARNAAVDEPGKNKPKKKNIEKKDLNCSAVQPEENYQDGNDVNPLGTTDTVKVDEEKRRAVNHKAHIVDSCDNIIEGSIGASSQKDNKRRRISNKKREKENSDIGLSQVLFFI